MYEHIVDIPTSKGDLIITKVNDRYNISVDHRLTQIKCDADTALKALGTYLHTAELILQKMQGKDSKALLDEFIFSTMKSLRETQLNKAGHQKYHEGYDQALKDMVEALTK